MINPLFFLRQNKQHQFYFLQAFRGAKVSVKKKPISQIEKRGKRSNWKPKKLSPRKRQGRKRDDLSRIAVNNWTSYSTEKGHSLSQENNFTLTPLHPVKLFPRKEVSAFVTYLPHLMSGTQWIEHRAPNMEQGTWNKGRNRYGWNKAWVCSKPTSDKCTQYSVLESMSTRDGFRTSFFFHSNNE